MQTFKTAIQLAKWIKSQNVSELNQEKLMRIGVDNKKVYGVYCIRYHDIVSVTLELEIEEDNEYINSLKKEYMEHFQKNTGGL